MLFTAGSPAAYAADATAARSATPDFRVRPTSTYEKLLPLAVAGDAAVQNFLGFMFFYGEGVERDFEEARSWFHAAAQQGNVNAQLNLSLFYGGTLSSVPAAYKDLEESAIWLQRAAVSGIERTAREPRAIAKGEIDIGEKVYVTFCSSCHGMNGIATRPDAPSFARGERLNKSSYDLTHSIINGSNSMPPWGATLSAPLIEASLAYIREAYQRLRSAQGSPLWGANLLESTAELSPGARNYRTYCSGCHGFNGVAYYVNSPSFAFGERLEKSDQMLHRSIANGHGIMPSWDMMLTGAEIADIVRFLRTLNQTYRGGIGAQMGKRPPYYFRFRPLGETGDDWFGTEPAGARPARR